MASRKVYKTSGHRPMAAPNGGRGKQLPLELAGTPIPAVPRNRRERRALAAWQRKQAKQRRATEQNAKPGL